MSLVSLDVAAFRRAHESDPTVVDVEAEQERDWASFLACMHLIERMRWLDAMQSAIETDDVRAIVRMLPGWRGGRADTIFCNRHQVLYKATHLYIRLH